MPPEKMEKIHRVAVVKPCCPKTFIALLSEGKLAAQSL